MHLKHQLQLIQSGVLTEAQMSKAETIAETEKKSLITAMLEMPGVEDGALLNALSKIFKTPYVDLRSFQIDDELLQTCSDKLCRKYGFVPIGQSDTDIMIATDNPLDVNMLDALAFKLGKRIVPKFTRPDRIQAKIAELYQNSDSAFDAVVDDLDDEHALTQEM